MKRLIPLVDIRLAQRIRIHSLPEGVMRAYFLRLGLMEGDTVECSERLPGGTVVLRKNRREIAIGHRLAQEILVSAVNEEQVA